MKKLLVRWTYKIWHLPVYRCITHAYETQVIDSKQLHSLLALFDRTQKEYYRMEKSAR